MCDPGVVGGGGGGGGERTLNCLIYSFGVYEIVHR